MGLQSSWAVTHPLNYYRAKRQARSAGGWNPTDDGMPGDTYLWLTAPLLLLTCTPGVVILFCRVWSGAQSTTRWFTSKYSMTA